jgi:hypothetical protein
VSMSDRLRLRSAAAIALHLSVAGVMAACDPCSGIASCSSGAYLAATGQIVDPTTRQGVDGVRVDVIRASGIDVGQDSLSTVTRGGGFWRLEFAPRSVGTLGVDFVVSPPGEPAYRLHGVQLTTREHGGDANLNERWVTRLYFNHFLEIYRRGTVDDRIVGAQVTFTRTGGVALLGPGAPNGVYDGTTDFGGRLPLFPSTGDKAVYPTDDSPVIGDLTVTVQGLGTTVIGGISLAPSHIYNEIGAIERYDIGVQAP